MRRIVKYEPNQTLRYCDECGARYLSAELVQGSDMRFRCRRFCLERTLIDVDRAAASVHRQREAPPPPFGQAYGMNQSWMNEEDIFSMVVNLAPWPGTSLAMKNEISPVWPTGFPGRTRCAGEAIVYLYNIVAQGKRPASWLSLARAKISSLADLLLVNLRGGSGLFTGTYGLNLDGFAPYIANEAYAALGMLRAYQLAGKSEYLSAAKANANWLVNMQRSDLFSAAMNFTVSYGTSTPTFFGPWPTYVTIPAGHEVHAHSTMMAVEFLSALKAVAGDGSYGDTQFGALTGSAATTLTQSIASGLAFWNTAQYDTVAAATVKGFSSATPRDFWNPSLNTATTRNFWSLETAGSRDMFDVAWSLRSLFAVQGNTGIAADVYNWTMALAQNPAFVVPTDPPYLPTVANGVGGTFSPGTGIASLATSTATFVNASQSLVPSIFGCLASSLDKTALDYGKQNWGTQALRNMSDASQGLGVPAMYTYLGLSNQMSSAPSSGVLSVVDAAIFGNCYRYQQSYTGI